jgi:hypothetical protein
MGSKIEMTLQLLDQAYQIMRQNVHAITLEEALFVPQGGYRSIMGTLKHAAGWSHVYRSYAFDSQPKHWVENNWPHGLRDTIIKSEEYWRGLIVWFDGAHQHWVEDLASSGEGALDELRPLHWGAKAPLHEIVLLVAQHHVYHAGELNQILSICRGEAWEENEEVEENNMPTVGHRVRPPWMDGDAN